MKRVHNIMASNVLLCSFCDFRSQSRFTLLKHMRDAHENDSNFSVIVSYAVEPIRSGTR